MQIDPVVFKIWRLISSQLDGGRYVLAVSGGADSLALADAAAELMHKGRCSLLVCHVEHGIRGQESLDDAALTERFCADRGLPFICVHADARASSAAAGLSLEDAARRLRYRALYDAAESFGAGYVVTAHHRDDQAETVLLKLLRGAGPEGLSAMRRREGRLLRPLLAAERCELEEYCRLRGIEFCRDSTNDDVFYTRNRVRHMLLPFLERNFNPSVRDSLVRTAELLQRDCDCLEQLAEEEYVRCAAAATGTVELQADRLRKLPAAVRSRIIRKAYFSLGGQELSRERTEALETLLLRGTGGKKIQLPGAIEAVYAKHCLKFVK